MIVGGAGDGPPQGNSAGSARAEMDSQVTTTNLPPKHLFIDFPYWTNRLILRSAMAKRPV
jgi:hypothetical protein